MTQPKAVEKIKELVSDFNNKDYDIWLIGGLNEAIEKDEKELDKKLNQIISQAQEEAREKYIKESAIRIQKADGIWIKAIEMAFGEGSVAKVTEQFTKTNQLSQKEK